MPITKAKLYALTHTRLETALYLDADAYSVADPAPLLAAARGHPTGFAYWRDLPHNDGSVGWPAVWPAGAGATGPVQGGQLAVHRPACWPELAAAHWMCQHSDYYFGHFFGDQDAWRVAWAATERTPLVLGPAAHREGAGFVCGHAGTEYVVHRCDDKMFHTPLPGEARAWAHFAAAIA